MTTFALDSLDPVLKSEYETRRALGLRLDLTRGKPSQAQLDLAIPMFADTAYVGEGGDYRNYGLVEGIPEARKLFAEFLGTTPEKIFVLGNSSLAIMHDIVVQMLLRPLGERDSLIKAKADGMRPAFLCPVPCYDRYLKICEQYGIDMLAIPMTDEGPSVEAIEKAIRTRNVFGMWCVPKYSNPTGHTYSARVCEALASLKARPGFRIIWDLAYQVHDLTDTPAELPEFLTLCEKSGNPDRAFVIGSTSKITLASAGLALVASSPANLAWFKESLSIQNIGPDKLNQLRHVRFLRDMEGVRAHMRKHRAIIEPKFRVVDEMLTAHFGNSQDVRWNKPDGGYFISLYVKPGTARRVVDIAESLGVKLTPAGSAYPFGVDPNDSHIRLAPSFPPLHEIEQAMLAIVLAIKIAAAL